jgi:hypothetical protein
VQAPTDRRGFFRAALTQIAAGAAEAGSGLARAERPSRPAAAAASPTARAPSTVRASPAGRCASLEDLMGLAADAGLAERSRDVRALVRPSARLIGGDATSVPAEGDVRPGLARALPLGATAPVRDGRALTLLADIALADASVRGLAGLPAEGRLLFFYDTAGKPSAAMGGHGDGASVIFVPATPETTAEAMGTTAGGQAAGLFAELALPRVWSAPVQELGLDAHERDAWEALRQALADLQGVELDEGTAADRALHRVLGYPDERRGTMPLLCELLARGHDVPNGYPDLNAAGDEAQAGSRRWRLLLQLSADDTLGWSWGGSRTRLYFWWDEHGPRADGLPPVCAVCQ